MYSSLADKIDSRVSSTQIRFLRVGGLRPFTSGMGHDRSVGGGVVEGYLPLTVVEFLPVGVYSGLSPLPPVFPLLKCLVEYIVGPFSSGSSTSRPLRFS